ncbi:MAG: Lrp/AsnC family leucine-responsive transcriptional regulator [Parasphingorhabdus sp.]|jgi:Lrp/AsnC family leucine-responsive transcriptional regulator|tara:strand:- start:3419 stop:3898 length:480 start_codon:yes stop_codon:yes gene_type:complete
MQLTEQGEYRFDATDLAIITKLKRNGRATNREIAKDLNLTANTVSTRIRQMEAADQLRVIAVSDFAAHNHNVLIQVAVELDNRSAKEAAMELAAFPEVFAAHIVNGSYDIDLLLAVEDFDAVKRFMLDSLAKVRGIRSMTPAIAIDIVKYSFDQAFTET